MVEKFHTVIAGFMKLIIGLCWTQVVPSVCVSKIHFHILPADTHDYSVTSCIDFFYQIVYACPIRISSLYMNK
jgi:hypothetical protein